MSDAVCLLLIDDGREDYLEFSRASLKECLPPFAHEVLVSDADHRLGATRARIEGWRRARETGARWIWHAESDFLYEDEVPLARIIAVMDRHPEMVQMSLMRQGVKDEIGRLEGEGVTEVREGGEVWMQHRMWFTCNPSLYRVLLTDRGWPDEEHSEGKFGGRLFRDHEEAVSGIWGAYDDPPRVRHIGRERTGHGY